MTAPFEKPPEPAVRVDYGLQCTGLRQREALIDGMHAMWLAGLAAGQRAAPQQGGEDEAVSAVLDVILEGHGLSAEHAAFIRRILRIQNSRLVALEAALRGLHDEKCDYMTINLLGDPATQYTIKQARAAMPELTWPSPSAAKAKAGEG